MKIAELQTVQDPKQVITLLLEKNPQVIQDGVHDHLLVEQFFSTLDESFKTRHLVTEQEVENFKKNFNYEAVGIKREEQVKVQKKIEKVKSIDRIITLIEKSIPEDMKKSIVIDHIIKVWIKENYKGNLNDFISGLNKSYWNLE